MKSKHILTAMGMTLLSLQSVAQDTYTTTAVPFLRINPDARTAGMGNAGLAISPDANSVFSNQARLPFAQNRSAVSATYSPWMKDIHSNMYVASMAGYHQIGGGQSLSASVRYFSMGTIDMNDYNGAYVQSVQPREFALDLGYARKLSSSTGIGLAVRYIRSKLADGNLDSMQFKSGSSLAADLSFYYTGLDTKGQGWSFGAALTNLGSKISYSNNASGKDFIPAKLGLGGAYSMVFNEDNQLTLAADLNKLLVPSVQQDSVSILKYQEKGVMEGWVQSFDDYNRLQFSAGAEYTYNRQFSLRTGYYAETKNEGGRDYFTAGAGLSYQAFSFHFSYLVPFNDVSGGRNPLSNTLRFGLLYAIK